MKERPQESEYAPYFAGYVGLVSESDVLAVLKRQVAEIKKYADAVSARRETYRYAVGKWSVREVFGHLVDAEHVFAYRAFCISRGETAALPSFDEKPYVELSAYDRTPLAEIVTELATLRKANLFFLERAGDEAWRMTGTAGGNPVTVRALAYIMAGHVRHHFQVLRDRYVIRPRG